MYRIKHIILLFLIAALVAACASDEEKKRIHFDSLVGFKMNSFAYPRILSIYSCLFNERSNISPDVEIRIIGRVGTFC